ncbi:MAG TPA: tetratricopeptide repeat protein [Candidatus Omnitrophota bacterium]|nr:tetratricopeptide repeat protein [Candidatus Omnitrophota bacterium]
MAKRSKVSKTPAAMPIMSEPWCLLASWRPYIIIAVLGLLVYIKAAFFNYTYLDDNNLILDNFYFIKNLANVLTAFGQDIFRQFGGGEIYYRPLMTISFMLDAQWGGTSPMMYHVTNIILHLIASCLVFFLLIKLDFRKDVSLLLALLFSVHPVLSQAVGWIPGRNDPLLAIFLLPSFIMFIKMDEGNRSLRGLLSVVLFFLSLLTKETAMLLPPLCLLYAWLFRRPKLAPAEWGAMIAGWCAAVVPWFLLRSAALKYPMELKPEYIVRSLVVNFPATVQMIGKIFLPFNLSVLPIMRDTTFIYGAAALIGLLAWTVYSKERDLKMVLFGAAWFLLFLLPSFVRPNPDLPADFIEHRLYLPMAGMLMLLAATMKGYDLKKKVPLACAAALLATFSAITFVHLDVFRDRISFWENAAANSPHYPLAHRNLGAMYYLAQDYTRAFPEYQKALVLNPNEPMAHNNLGLIYMNHGQLAEAEMEYKKEIAINPNYDTVHFNLGLLYFSQKKAGAAEAEFKRTLEINPEYIDAYKYLTVLYYEQRRMADATACVRELQRRGIEVPPGLLKALKLDQFIQ